MKRSPYIVTVFNNKGGVGKTTLTFHLAHALGELGKKVLLIDLDPQCNLTIFSMAMEEIHKVWAPEDKFVDDFNATRISMSAAEFDAVASGYRSIHFYLKPTEDGTEDLKNSPRPVSIGNNVDIIPGRLTLHLYEAKVGERWSGVYQGDPLAIRTATRIRSLAHELSALYGYDLVILDTSPSLGALNRNLLSLADGFIIPCAPDLFSVYGIRNIGSALSTWRKQFESIFHFLSDAKRGQFPEKFVRYLGYTLYNAKKYSGSGNTLDLAKAHYNYAREIPETIRRYIAQDSMIPLEDARLFTSVGGKSVIHSHNTFPSMSQKYHVPMWSLPDYQDIEIDDKMTVGPNKDKYYKTKVNYTNFARDFLERVALLDV